MAGIQLDFYGQAAVVPGDGRPREVARILDKDDNIYSNDTYIYLTNGTRQSVREIVENPPGSAGPTVVTSSGTLTANRVTTGTGLNGGREIQSTPVTLTQAGVMSGLTGISSSGTVTFNGNTLPGTTGTNGYVLTTNGAGTTSWSNPTGIAVTSITNEAGAGEDLVVGGPQGAVTVKNIRGGGGTTVTSDATDIIITAAGISGSGTDNRITRWDGTNAVQDSAVTLSDNGDMTAVRTINSTVLGTLTGTGVSDKYAVIATDVESGATLTLSSTNQHSAVIATDVSTGGLSLSGTNNLVAATDTGTGLVTMSGQEQAMIACNQFDVPITLNGNQVMMGGVYSEDTTTTNSVTGRAVAFLGSFMGGGSSYATAGTAIGVLGFHANDSGGATTFSGTGCVAVGVANQSNTGASSLAGTGCAVVGCTGSFRATGVATAIVGGTDCFTNGKNNTVIVASTSTAPLTDGTLCLGNGAGSASTSNRKAEITNTGYFRSAIAAGTYGNAGAAFEASYAFDYAEFFPNATGQVIPFGCLLSQKRGAVKPAVRGERVIGVASSTPAYIANGSWAHWPQRYKTDKFGRVTHKRLRDDEDHPDPVAKRTRLVPDENEAYDPSIPYVPRAERPAEHTITGLMGQVYVRVDETVGEDDYVDAGDAPGNGTKAAGVTRIQCMKVTTPYDAAEGYAVALCLVL